MSERWSNERGHEHASCWLCGADCSTHPDAANPLSGCGDCGRVTCPDHRVLDDAERCNSCAAVFYGADSMCGSCGEVGHITSLCPDDGGSSDYMRADPDYDMEGDY